jgi:hypothetical protein
LLLKMRAPTQCLLISSNKKLDQKALPLQEALNSIVGMGYGTLVICVPDKLGYFEGEEQNDRWLLAR